MIVGGIASADGHKRPTSHLDHGPEKIVFDGNVRAALCAASGSRARCGAGVPCGIAYVARETEGPPVTV